MLGSEYPWLLAPFRAAAGRLARLVRGSLLALAAAVFGLTCTLLPAAHLAPALTVSAAPAVAQVQESAGAEWPRTLIRLWFILPHLVPHDH